MNTANRIDALLDEWCDTDDREKRDEIAGEIKKLAALAPPSGEGVDDALVRQSVARGWCAPESINRIAQTDDAMPVATVATLTHPELADKDSGPFFTAQDWAALRHLPGGTKLYTTPQSAPVDGGVSANSGKLISDVMSHHAPKIVHKRGDSFPEYTYTREQVLSMLWDLQGNLTTPPPASQERGGDRERVLEMFLGRIFAAQRKNEAGEYVGWKISGNGSLNEVVAEAREYLNCPISPPSAAEASINPPEIDSKLIPDAAEQAKPVSIQQMFDAEQAQAGEHEPFWSEKFVAGVKRLMRRDGLPELPENRYAGLFTADQVCEYANAAIRSRLAGGVTDKYDELIYAVHSKYPNETRHETALRYIRERENSSGGAAMVAALGAK